MIIEHLKAFDLVYVASPYSKYAKGLDRAFMKIARITGRLIELGVNAYSPIAHTHSVAQYAYLDPLDHSLWLPYDEIMMRKSDAMCVAMMHGWDSSVGVQYEIDFFNKADKPVLFLHPSIVDERP